MAKPKTPQPHDLPRTEIVALAQEAIDFYKKKNPAIVVEVYYKFTCAHCGERCTFAEANALYEQGQCHTCGKITPIEKAGFMLVLDVPTPEQRRPPS